MKAVKFFLYAILGLILILLLLGLVLPKSFEVTREITIDAPLSLVFRKVSSLKDQHTWSPWKDLDPDQSVTFEGEDRTPGAIMRWSGNKDVGQGQMTIVNIVPKERVEIDLNFKEPFEASSKVWFTLSSEDEKTKVTWSMAGVNPFPMNVMGLLFNMKGTLKKQFDTGLTRLKEQAEEKVQNTVYQGYTVQVMDMIPRMYQGFRAKVAFADLKQYFEVNTPKIYKAIQSQKGNIRGPLCGLYYEWNEEERMADLAVALEVKEEVYVPGGETTRIRPTKFAVIDVRGKYESLKEAHMSMDQFLSDFGYDAALPVIEEYQIGPAETPDSTKWFTRILYPILDAD